MSCNLCGTEEPVSTYYYKGLDSNGLREDFYDSPELYSGSIEFAVNEDYTARTPREPTYYFLIDVTSSSYKANVPYYAIQAIKECLVSQRFNGEQNVSFGVAFFDGNLHLLDLQQNRANLFTVLPNMSKNYTLPKNDITFEDISQALAYVNIFLRDQGGRISLIMGNNKEFLPNMNVQDKTNRHFFYSNKNDFTKLSTELNKSMASVDIYCFGHEMIKNLSSLADTIRLSGANLCYYENENERNLNKFFSDLIFNISKNTTWEAVFRIRCSEGWKKSSYGNYYGTPYNDLLRVQHIDDNYSIFYTFEADPKFIPTKNNSNPGMFFIQTSLLYTNENRKRMIRVHNYVLPVNSRINEIYESVKMQTVLAAFLKTNILQIISNKSLVDIQIELINQLKLFLSSLAHHSSQEFQCEVMPYLALGFLGLLKNIVFQGQYINNFKNNSVDMLTYHRLVLNHSSSETIYKNINPSLFDLTEIGTNSGFYQNDEFVYPPLIRLSIEDVEKCKMCLLDDGLNLYLYIIEQVKQF